MIRRAIGWTIAGQILSFAATFGTTVALTRILTPREVGIFAIGLAVNGVLQALAAFGIGTYIVREHQLTPTVLSTAFTINAITACLLAIALVVSSFVPAVTMGEPMVAAVLRILALVPLLGIVEFRPATMLQREMGFSAIALITVARTVAIAVVSLVSALAGASALSAAYGAVAGALLGAVTFSIVARRHGGFSLTLTGWRSMISFGLQTLAIGGIAALAFRLSDFLLGSILGLVALGFYSRATALSGVPITNIYQGIARVLFVKFAEDARAGNSLRNGYLRGLDMMLAVLWPVLAGLALLSGPLVQMLFGARWMAVAAPLAILSVGQMIALSFAMNYELFVLRDEVTRQTRIEIVRTVISLAIFAYSCTLGIIGAAIGRLIDPVIGMVLYLPQISRLSGASTKDLLLIYARNAVVTAAVMLPPGFALLWMPAGASVRYAVLAVALFGSGLCWLVVLWSMRHPLWNEIEHLIRSWIPVRQELL